MLIATLSTSYVLAFGGFLIMLASALFVEHNARKMGRAGLQEVAGNSRAAGLRDAFGNAGRFRVPARALVPATKLSILSFQRFSNEGKANAFD